MVTIFGENLVPIRDAFETTALQLAAHALMQLGAILKNASLSRPL